MPQYTLMFALHQFISRTRWGMAMRAMSFDYVVVPLMGVSINTIARLTFAIGSALAAAMTVNTRRTKMEGFLFAAFWAGIAGGLFAHVLRYVNPSTFGLQKLAEVLAMVYFSGLNSVVGSIVGTSFTV